MKTLRGGGALLGTLRRGHTTGMKSKVHPTYKTKYRVANWPAYNQALVRRGDVTVWLSSEAIAAWTPRRSGRRGGQRRYSDLAIETALTLRLLYHLPMRQAEGWRCCMKTRCGWGGLARTFRDASQEPHYRDAVEGSSPV